MRRVASHLIVAAALLLATACTSDLSLTGSWVGGNALYPHVTLTLVQTGDSLTGSATVRLASPADSSVSTPLAGSRHGDSLYVRGLLMPSLGGVPKFVVEFGGRVVVLTDLSGSIDANKGPVSNIFLTRVGGSY